MRSIIFLSLLSLSLTSFAQVRQRFYIDSITINKLSTPILENEIEFKFIIRNYHYKIKKSSPTYILVKDYPQTVVFEKPMNIVISSDIFFQVVNPLAFNKLQNVVTFSNLDNSIIRDDKLYLSDKNNSLILHLRKPY